MSEFERGFVITLLVAFFVAVWALSKLGNRHES